jgi:hypothetical protein
MKSNFFAIVLIAVTLFSCKDNKKETNAEVNADEPKKENFFKVTFDVVVKKDDNFHLYYTEDGSINFNEKQSVWVPVKGSEKEQEVVFNLPEDAAPSNLRVDLGYGVNKEQSDIVLNKFKMDYFGKSFEAKDSLIYNYFYENKDNTIIDKKTNTIKRLKVDQETAPSLYPHIPLAEEIAKMVK